MVKTQIHDNLLSMCVCVFNTSVAVATQLLMSTNCGQQKSPLRSFLYLKRTLKLRCCQLETEVCSSCTCCAEACCYTTVCDLDVAQTNYDCVNSGCRYRSIATKCAQWVCSYADGVCVNLLDSDSAKLLECLVDLWNSTVYLSLVLNANQVTDLIKLKSWACKVCRCACWCVCCCQRLLYTVLSVNCEYWLWTAWYDWNLCHV